MERLKEHETEEKAISYKLAASNRAREEPTAECSN